MSITGPSSTVNSMEAAPSSLPRPDQILRNRIQPPEGVIPVRWSRSSVVSEPAVDLNELLPLTLYWAELDPSVAEDLIRSAFALQGDDGSICRIFRSDGQVISPLAPWPLLIRCARRVCEKVPDLRDWVIPRCEAWLHWARGHFDPDGDGIPQWTSATEALIPESWDPELAGLDLASLLLSEVESLRDLIGDSSGLWASPKAVDEFERDLHATIASCASEKQKDTLFHERYLDGRPVQRVTLSRYLPLLTQYLPRETRQHLAALLENSPCLQPAAGFAAWETWPDDKTSAPVPVALQELVLTALATADEDAALRMRRAIRSRLEDLWTHDGRLPTDLAISPSEDRPRAAADGGAAALTLLSTRFERKALSATGSRPWFERRRRVLIAALVAVVLVPIAGLIWITRTRPAPSSSTMESLLSLGDECLKNERPIEAETLFRKFISLDRGRSGIAHLLLGNALFRQDRFPESEAEYRLALNDEQSSLHALYNLALALQRQGRLEEAMSCLRQFLAAYEKDAPDVAARASAALQLIQDQRMMARLHSENPGK